MPEGRDTGVRVAAGGGSLKVPWRTTPALPSPLPRDEGVDLVLRDVAGRRVRTVPDGERMTAGAPAPAFRPYRACACGGSGSPLSRSSILCRPFRFSGLSSTERR
jgi:hypothetical protein